MTEVTFFYTLCDFCLAFKVYLCVFLLFWWERQEKTPRDCHFDAISLTGGHSLVRTGPGALIFSYKDSTRTGVRATLTTLLIEIPCKDAVRL